MPDVFPLTASLPEGKKQQQKTGTELTVGALKKKEKKIQYKNKCT